MKFDRNSIGGDQQVHGHRQAGREKLGGEESAHALLADARSDEGHVGDEREDHRHGYDRRGRDVDTGNNARDIHREHTEEQEPDEAGELATRLGAEHVKRNVVTDVPGDGLDSHLTTGGHELGLTRNGHQHEAHDQAHDDAG